MQSAKLPYLARGEEIFLLTSFFIGSSYRKCAGGKHSAPLRLLRAGTLVDRTLRFFDRHPFVQSNLFKIDQSSTPSGNYPCAHLIKFKEKTWQPREYPNQ